jgi:hypothetical protein
MTFIRKHSGDRTMPIVAVYTCPEHGEFDAEVQRDENGEAPDVIPCDRALDAVIEPGRSESGYQLRINLCGLPASWTPSPVVGRVKRFEVVRGKWEKPERPTYLDTRELGEGQSMDEFRAKRRAIWEEKRKADVMKFKREG